MKPLYLQTKVEQLQRDKETLQQTIATLNTRMTSIDTDIRMLHAELTLLKNKQADAKIPASELDVVFNLLIEKNSQQMRRFTKKAMKAINADINVLLKELGDMIFDALEQEHRFQWDLSDTLRRAHNDLVRTVNKIISIVDPDKKQVHDVSTVLNMKAMNRIVRNMRRTKSEGRCIPA